MLIISYRSPGMLSGAKDLQDKKRGVLSSDSLSTSSLKASREAIFLRFCYLSGSSFVLETRA